MRLHNRQVKAQFWTDTELIRILDIPGRMFYQGLWQLADDSGCLENDTLAFKIHLFPADAEITIEVIEKWVKTLIEAGKLIPYEAEGKQCFFLKNFHKHQKIKNPSPPEVPLPPWIAWEPYPSNDRTGKYVISSFEEMNDLQSSYEVLTDDLQSSSNLNLNHNLNLEPEPKKEYKESSLQPSAATPIEPQKPSNSEKKTIVFDENSVEFKLACYMRDLILETLPTAKVPDPTPKAMSSWCKHIDYMIRLDKRSPDEIAELFEWAQKDSFWCANIRSPRKLREKWDTLVLQRQRGKQPRDGPTMSKNVANALRLVEKYEKLEKLEEGGFP